jgi:hypothetical protein
MTTANVPSGRPSRSPKMVREAERRSAVRVPTGSPARPTVDAGENRYLSPKRSVPTLVPRRESRAHTTAQCAMLVRSLHGPRVSHGIPTSVQRVRSGPGTLCGTPCPSSTVPLDTCLRHVGYSANLAPPSASREGGVGPMVVGPRGGREPNRRAAPQSKCIAPRGASRACGQPGGSRRAGSPWNIS